MHSVEPASLDELRIIVEAMPERLLLMVLLAAWCALRYGELWFTSGGTRQRKVAGGPDLRFHDLRHTGATLAAQAGATTAELQARLGHTTSDAAMIDQHAAKGRDRRSRAQRSRCAKRASDSLLAMLTWLDRASSRLVLGAVAPVILFLTGWWGTLGVLGDNPAIGPAALGGLSLGVTLDFTVLRNRLDSLFDLGPIALSVLALFYSIMIYGFFMGLPVCNLLVGLVGGYAVGRKAALHGSSPENAVSAARVTAGVATAILAVLCAASAWMALNEPTIELQVRGMLGLPFEVTRSMIYATILGGGTALLAAQYSGTILIARRASQIA